MRACLFCVMPVHLENRGGQHCVVEPTGEVVESGCYSEESQALARLRAINANLKQIGDPTIRAVLESRIHQSFTVAADKLFGLGYIGREERIGLSSLIGDMLSAFGESIPKEIAEGIVPVDDARLIVSKEQGDEDMTENTAAYLYADGDNSKTDSTASFTTTTSNNATWVTVDSANDFEEKGIDLMPAPTTFDELDSYREESKKDAELAGVLSDFMALAGNVMSLGGSDKRAGLRTLAKEMFGLLKGEMPDEEDEEDEENENAFKAAPIKVDGGVEYHAKDYACVGDAQKPSTWKVRLAEGKSGNITVAQLGRAASALSPGGHRGNPANLQEVGCSKSAVKSRIRSEYKKLGVADEDIPDSVKASIIPLEQLKNKHILIWKTDDGLYRWMGVYSNKFRDDDKPVSEILSEISHKEFISRVNKGEIGHPDLYVWHIPVPVGKADLLAYDDSGFSVALGTFTNEKVAEALLNTTEDLAMSHGMPAEFIERDKDDPTIITRYVSTEVSVLPRRVAANKMTHFSILHSKEDKSMSIAPELRDQVVQMIGEEATSLIEGELAAQADKAVADGVEFKEQGEEVAQADTTSAVETTAPETQQAEAAAEEQVTEQAAEEAAQETEAEAETEEKAEPEEEAEEVKETVAVLDTSAITTLKEELVGVLTEFVKATDESNKQFSERLDALEQKIGKLERDEDEKFAEKAAGMTTTSLASMLAQQFAGAQAQSVIGQSATHVHGNSSLAKDGPEENLSEGESKEQAGLFFQKWTSGI